MPPLNERKNMEIRKIKITLGETEYTIEEARWKKAAEWKRGLVDDVKPLFGQVAAASTATFETAEDLLELWPLAQLVMVDGIELLFEHLMAYSDVLGSDSGHIEKNATEAQIFEAFVEVFKLSDPFGIAGNLTRTIGLRTMKTSSKPPGPNGE